MIHVPVKPPNSAPVIKMRIRHHHHKGKKHSKQEHAKQEADPEQIPDETLYEAPIAQQSDPEQIPYEIQNEEAIAQLSDQERNPANQQNEESTVPSLSGTDNSCGLKSLLDKIQSKLGGLVERVGGEFGDKSDVHTLLSAASAYPALSSQLSLIISNIGAIRAENEAYRIQKVPSNEVHIDESLNLEKEYDFFLGKLTSLRSKVSFLEESNDTLKKKSELPPLNPPKKVFKEPKRNYYGANIIKMQRSVDSLQIEVNDLVLENAKMEKRIHLMTQTESDLSIEHLEETYASHFVKPPNMKDSMVLSPRRKVMPLESNIEEAIEMIRPRMSLSFVHGDSFTLSIDNVCLEN